MSPCTFCEIIAGRLPSYRVAEDEHTVAFLDIAPANPGHTLVVPRAHAANIWDIPAAAYGQVAQMVHKVAALLSATLAPDGLNIVQANGEAAWQEVFHLHVHLVPRWHGDDLRLMWHATEAEPDELAQVQRRLTAT
ncbi:HIT family protein [Actinomadura geliboluensis]|uniref:HIT family protein n=1 Tax=Actinomadura geliboluensis TaxID=882440 RepID=A0A5S4G3K6_9ACTN|nr:HIT family protein [Actinomadura geliboluensis]TMR27094.1 HIT family protein [Actinomadura geliboluensis]